MGIPVFHGAGRDVPAPNYKVGIQISNNTVRTQHLGAEGVVGVMVQVDGQRLPLKTSQILRFDFLQCSSAFLLFLSKSTMYIVTAELAFLFDLIYSILKSVPRNFLSQYVDDSKIKGLDI